jgi:integrase/recombinase XerD
MSNIFKRGEVYWLRVKINGVHFRESLRTSSVSVARKEATKRIEELRNQIIRGEHKTPWPAAVVAWSEHVEKRVGPKTALRYAVSLKQCGPYLMPHTIQNINGKVIGDLIAGRSKEGASQATIKRDLTAISQVFEYAIAREWTEVNPVLAKRKLLRERRDPIVLPQHDAIETYIAAADPRFGDYIRAAWLTGARQDELATATWTGFNAAAGTLELIGKGNKRRVIKLSREAHALIARQVRVVGFDLIFCRPDGRRWREPATLFTHLRRAIMHTAAKEGRTVQRFRFHDLRHLFAVEALRDGRMGIYELSRHLGHTSVKTTEIYLEFLTPEEAATAGQAGSRMGSQPEETSNQFNMFG